MNTPCVTSLTTDPSAQNCLADAQIFIKKLLSFYEEEHAENIADAGIVYAAYILLKQLQDDK